MPESIVITSFDKRRILNLMPLLEADVVDREDFRALAEEVGRATEVAPTEVDADVVTMNSRVRVTDLARGTSLELTIVFPGMANYDKGRVSVLAPLGTALLGSRAGEEVEWELPGGTRKLRIDEVVFQPEAAGLYDL